MSICTQQKNVVRGAKPTGEAHVCDCGDHAFANIGHGFSVLVSPADIEHLRYRWCAQVTRRGYVIVSRKKTVAVGKQRSVVLAREILGLEDAAVLADHADRNSLDNRRSNIRPASFAQNAHNSVPALGATGRRGVYKRGSRFVGVIKAGGRKIHLGTFDTPEAAHVAYASAAVKLFGEFARIE